MTGTSRRPIYLDHAASTPMRREVRDVVRRRWAEDFGNPSSAHAWGRAARRRLEEARSKVADALGATEHRVVFTRGGTESDNLAVLGRARRDLARGRPAHVATTAIEHPAVGGAAAQAVSEGGAHTVLELEGGELDLDALDRVLESGPSVVSCIWVDNDTGLLLPVDRVGERCRRRGVAFHSDAVQAVGKVPVALGETPVDLLTVAGHKLHGPKGTGALLVRDAVALQPLHFGGGQEGGLRPGTEDVAGAVGLAEAIRLAVAELESEAARMARTTAALRARLLERASGLRVHGDGLPRAPHILSLGVAGADGDTLLAALDAAGIAASGGSACASGSSAPSAAVTALAPGRRDATLRLSVGRLFREADVEGAARAVELAIRRTREWVAA